MDPLRARRSCRLRYCAHVPAGPAGRRHDARPGLGRYRGRSGVLDLR